MTGSSADPVISHSTSRVSATSSATGVLIDAFVVRTLLVPSLMALLGRWNWWAPRGLRRLHRRLPALEPEVAAHLR